MAYSDVPHNSSCVDILAFSLPSFDPTAIFLLKHMIKAMDIEAVSVTLNVFILPDHRTKWNVLQQHSVFKGKINCTILIQCKSTEPKYWTAWDRFTSSKSEEGTPR